MVRLAKSEALGRIIRMDDLSELTVPTWVKIKEAIQAGKTQEALELADYIPIEGRRVNDLMCDIFWGAITYIADNFGEEEVYKALRQMGEANYRKLQKLTPEEFAQLRVESMRVHRIGSEEMGIDTVTEEEDRYVLTLNPCGSGGRMRRTGRTEPPFQWAAACGWCARCERLYLAIARVESDWQCPNPRCSSRFDDAWAWGPDSILLTIYPEYPEIPENGKLFRL